MRFSAKHWAYSDMPSFSSQSAICCIASPYGLNAIRSGPTGQKVYHKRRLIAALAAGLHVRSGSQAVVLPSTSYVASSPDSRHRAVHGVVRLGHNRKWPALFDNVIGAG